MAHATILEDGEMVVTKDEKSMLLTSMILKKTLKCVLAKRTKLANHK